MQQKRFSRGIRKYIRRQKARIRKECGVGTQDAKRRIEELLKELRS